MKFTPSFESASRVKLRFETPNGSLSVEDLWDLPLTAKTNRANLDDIAKGLSRKLRESAEESFVSRRSDSDAATELAFEIVKHIISVRVAEADAKLDAERRRQEIAKIDELIASKQHEALASESVEELRARRAALASQ